MKAHSPSKRALRALTISGCVCALALPAAAGARPIAPQPVDHAGTGAAATPAVTYHPHGRPAAYSSEAYSPPAGFASDTQSNGSPAAVSQAPSVVVREVHTVTNGSNHTLAIVLASAALGIALCGSGYAVIRTSRLQRRVAESGS
jgi:hypothetical protein